MYAFIQGLLSEISTDHIIIENNGMGYQVYVPFNSSFAFPSEGERVKVYTSLSVSENGISLYGFFTREDREMYNRLITVSGIGPKGAIALLSTLTCQEIILAILNDDDKAISKAPGIGPKTARRMIVDLKDKIDVSEDSLLSLSSDSPVKSTAQGAISEAIMALSALGYSYAEAARAVKSVEKADSLDVETLLSLALKEM